MKRRATRMVLLVWLALLALLALTLASAYLPLGTGNMLINYLIAALKALLVAAFFMHLRRGRALYLLVALTGLLTLALLLGLSQTDYRTRTVYRAPFQAPQAVAPALGTRPGG